MEGTVYEQFFTDPDQTYHRRYEALRAVFVDERSQREVAEEFGYTHGSMRQLVLEFRRYCDDEDTHTEDFFFETDGLDVPSLLPRTVPPSPSRRSRIAANWSSPVWNRCR